ncbi:MAG TPA: adenylate/guanylate cyclase domain-containing protein, partial [Gaiellaceae bacterium]|nr:adenylate/guanylate cyclase domain-containing protein [Gaiellaceae bacterium]
MPDALSCPACGSANEPGRKFCGECGTSLSVACPSCGTTNPPAMKFCGECGAALAADAPVRPTPASAPAAERRLVSVLFADLVGYTALSEGRDFEDVRDLQTRYFDTARTVIERYGGTIEKFIGDAVMAIWGAPVAREDDAERAVRAALELVDAVATMGGAADLRLRAGVLTGEAAVTVGAEGQGMVTGDLVNTASRIQSAAAPGTVLVGDSTHRATEAAIAYTAAGERELKGKAEPVQLWQALRVIANRGGEGRSVGLESPFVGRERELRLAKELFHATVDEGGARLLSIVGTAGMGKSRLSWEFEKYLDGLVDNVYWHRGRCLAYGEGVAYWALADMVRMRARITEDEPAETAIPKLSEAIAEAVEDPDERAFIEPRLQHLLGLTERVAPDREDLFSAWRLFVERMAQRDPVVMVFEDIHWADAALLEFVEALLERSRSHPIFVLTLARPDLVDRHPGWGARVRSFTSVTLDPLDDDAIDALLRGLVPGIELDAIARIRERAEGVPFYAVETVRMLLDRGLLEPGEAGYRVTGDLSALQIPETLQTLIAARLDALVTDERALLQDASVLGRTFNARGLAALAGGNEESLRPLLDDLVRKELLYLDNDPFSPERGQYGFLQALVQRVAYETLSRRDRKGKHLAAAAYLAENAGIDPDEIAEVVAAHYLDAFRADEDADDAADIRASARDWLERAGERATSLAAAEEAQRAFEAAAVLADDLSERARLIERAGDMARMGNRMNDAEQLLTRARDLYTEAGDPHGSARTAAGIARALVSYGRTQDAIRLAEEAYEVLGADELDRDGAALAAELARLHFFVGDLDTAMTRIESAIPVAERTKDMALLASTLNTKSMVYSVDRPHEAYALVQAALRIALDHDLVYEALRAYNNSMVQLEQLDRSEDTLAMLEEAVALARRRGDRQWLDQLTAAAITESVIRGHWDEAEAHAEEYEPATTDITSLQAYADLADIAWERGDASESRRRLDRIATASADPGNRQWRQALLTAQRTRCILDGSFDGALETALEEVALQLETREQDLFIALALRPAASLLPLVADRSPAVRTLAAVNDAFAGDAPRTVTATTARLEGVLASLRGDHDAAVEQFGVALAAARSLDYLPWVAEILVDYATSLIADDRREDADPLLVEAREIAEQLRWVRL